MAGNAVPAENLRVIISERFIGKDGKPEVWELGCISPGEDEELRKNCVIRVPVSGGRYATQTDTQRYLGLLAARCTVYPKLDDAALQDSYGVMGSDALLKTMLTPGEYAELIAKAQEVCGFTASFEELAEEAKN